jgi:CTP:molybdopterin cytidylyltransferase MocA
MDPRSASRGAPVETVVAVVLAAGASSRMGRPKALLDLDGQTVLERVLGACAGGGAAAAVLVTSPGGEAVRAGGATGPLPVLQAVNPNPERGMLSSLQVGLQVLPAGTAGFLLFPVDFPIVPADEVARLREAFAARLPGQRIFIPSFQRRRGHPVLIDAELGPEFLALGAEASARVVLAAHDGEIAYVAAADDRVLMDMDTPEDYQRCQARLRQG